MFSADSNKISKHPSARPYLRRLIVLTLCLICISGSTSLAQAGRKQTQTEAEIDKAKNSQSSEQNDNKEKQLTPDFIIISAPPDFLPENHLYSNYSQPPDFESLARKSCLIELKKLAGTNVIEDENLPRWEARETALTEDNVWVVWMELKWETAISVYASPFRLRYVLFEPGTGKLAASGVGTGIKQTWGLPQRSATLEEQLQQAGRNIADQVLFEVKKRLEN